MAETLTICWVFPDGTRAASFQMLWLRGVLPLLGRLGLEWDGPGRGGHFPGIPGRYLCGVLGRLNCVNSFWRTSASPALVLVDAGRL